LTGCFSSQVYIAFNTPFTHFFCLASCAINYAECEHIWCPPPGDSMPGAPALELPEASLAVHRHRKKQRKFNQKPTKNSTYFVARIRDIWGIYIYEYPLYYLCLARRWCGKPLHRKSRLSYFPPLPWPNSISCFLRPAVVNLNTTFNSALWLSLGVQGKTRRKHPSPHWQPPTFNHPPRVQHSQGHVWHIRFVAKHAPHLLYF